MYILNFRQELTSFALYYVGRHTIMIACVNVNINTFMYLISSLPTMLILVVFFFFGEDYRGKNKNWHWLYKVYKYLFLLPCKTTNLVCPHTQWSGNACIKVFPNCYFIDFFQNWNRKCSEGLISNWVLTRLTREFCLFDDQDNARLHMYYLILFCHLYFIHPFLIYYKRFKHFLYSKCTRSTIIRCYLIVC